MEDSKIAAKAFVDKYFPQPSSKYNDVLSDLFPPNPQQESFRKQGYQGQSSRAQNATADWCAMGKAGKSHNTPQKSGNAVVYCEASEPCSMSSSVDYGCRDNYYPSAHAHQEKKDNKDGYECPDPEHSRGEWWQGSLYY